MDDKHNQVVPTDGPAEMHLESFNEEEGANTDAEGIHTQGAMMDKIEANCMNIPNDTNSDPTVD